MLGEVLDSYMPMGEIYDALIASGLVRNDKEAKRLLNILSCQWHKNNDQEQKSQQKDSKKASSKTNNANTSMFNNGYFNNREESPSERGYRETWEELKHFEGDNASTSFNPASWGARR